MRRDVRALALLSAAAFRASPLLALVALVLVPLGSLTYQVQAILLKAFADSLSEGATSRAAAAAALIGATIMLTSGVGTVGGNARMTLAERAGFVLQRRLAELSSRLPGIEHHERPDYQDKLLLLQAQEGMLGSGINQLVHSITIVGQVAFTTVLLVRVHPLMLLMPLFGVPSAIVTAANQRLQRRVEEEIAEQERHQQHLVGLVVQPGAAKELRVFNLEDEIERRNEESWRRTYRVRQRAAWITAARGSAAFVLANAGFVAAVALTAWRAASGLATPGDVLLAATLARQLVSLVAGTAAQLGWLLQALRVGERLVWLEDYSREIAARSIADAPVPDRIESGIALRNVSFRYPETEAWVLRDIDLDLPAGSVVALVGENGAGKTTLVKLLCRFYDPTEGTIVIDGVDLRRIVHEAWRERISGAFQDFSKLQLLARESVGVGDLPRVDDESAVRSALDRAGSSDLEGALPRGLATQLGRSWHEGVELSVGQWQKLALGRAMMRDAPLLLVLDEPTASLDAETEHALFARYATAARRAAITLLVSHRFSTVRMADLIVVLEGGRVVEQGTHAELVSAGGLYAELYGIQSQAYR